MFIHDTFMTLLELKKEIKKKANPQKAKLLQGFFKTGKGQYGEGDIFWGIIVPIQREIVKKYQDLSLGDIQKLLNSKIHEERLIALLILVLQFKKGDIRKQKVIFDFYLKNTRNINNWDLVDLTTPNIVGQFLIDKNRKIIYKLAKSHDLWEKRIATLSTFTFIKNNQFEDTLRIAEILLKDKHDLIHKAVGWMLREVGKRDLVVEEELLKKHYRKMPRTMLRYAIEKFPEKKRKKYLQKDKKIIK
jgi:3-methyladenine DNA glycosylase AlkD